jgi:multiple sugar transport system ATP-binding protein
VALIELREVSKRYADGTEAVNGLSLDIADGELMVLVGPSGCGKSTALRMIAGLERITSGELLIDGERMNDRAPSDRDIAMVFQSYALYPQMSVRENMGFPLKLARVPRAKIRSRVDAAARALDLVEHLERRPANLSGGQRQRVAMGRAIVRDPKAYLMDEPLSNLDAKLRVHMRAEVARIQSRVGTTMVYVTHDQTEAMTLGHRVVVMRDGIVQQIGPPQELYDAPINLFVAGFIGSPAMNFIPGEIVDGALRLPIGDVPLADERRRALERAGGVRRVVCGIRPEHFEDATLVSAEQRARGAVAEVRIEVVEDMGSQVYAYFETGAPVESARLAEAQGGADADAARRGEVAARLDHATRVAKGESASLWFDVTRIELFDAGTGEAIR